MGGIPGRVEERGKGHTVEEDNLTVRTSINFSEYRQWYYFFQYQFFIRSEQGKRRSAPESRIAQFLRNLHYDFMEEHYRWEIPSTIVPQPSNRKLTGADPAPLAAGNRTILYKSKKPSIRHRYMLFTFPAHHRADHISLLYKTLLVYDMLQRSMTEYAITKQLIDQAETLPSIARLRASITWYDQLFDNSIGTFERSETTVNPNDPTCNIDVQFIERYADKPFLKTTSRHLEKNAACLRGEREGQHEPVRSRVSDIHRYKRIAVKLIELAQSSHFNSFPSEIALIK
jgi:hypothetical protein